MSLITSISTQTQTILTVRHEELDGNIWACIDNRPDPSGEGQIYRFRQRPGENPLPHRELTAEEMLQRLQSPSLKESAQILGYNIYQEGEEWIMEIPDRKALEAGWKKLQETHPQLLPLDIVSSEGYSDEMRTRDFITGRISIAMGREFVYQQQVNVLSALTHALNPPNENVEKARQWVQQAHSYIETAEKTDMLRLRQFFSFSMSRTEEMFEMMKATLGGYVAILSGLDAEEYRDAIPLLPKELDHALFINALWLNPSTAPEWHTHFRTRFTSNPLNPMQCSRVWEVLKANAPTPPPLHNMDGAIWKCIEKKEAPGGKGSVYSFRERPGFNPFPAVELSAESLEKRLESPGLKEHAAFLGYRVYQDGEDWIMELPDREALLERWEMLRANDPELPELNIVTEAGIADDEAFALNFIRGRVILSTGKEFVHDQQLHVLAAISFALNKENTLLDSAREWLKVAYIKVRVAEKTEEEFSYFSTLFGRSKEETAHMFTMMKATLGAYADKFSAETATFYQENGIPIIPEDLSYRSFIDDMWFNPDKNPKFGWDWYFRHRFVENDLFLPMKCSTFWNKIMQLSLYGL